ncbi:MAG: hypothetical protein ACE361_11450 [Aureliella sp.]
MRLTLRTLLAYRDGVLGAEDAEEMHRRIHQSEDASNLLRRVERVTTSVGRTSTTLVGKGLGGDPNSIAEYLDDVLPKEKVPELERICLESDEYLNELASCHTLLSSAMHTRVPLPPELRELAKSVGDPEQASKLREQIKDRRQSKSSPKMIRRIDTAEPVAGPHGLDSKDRGDRIEKVDVTKEESNEGVDVVAPMLRSGGESIKEQGLSLEGASLTHEVPEYLLGNRGGGWRIPLGIIGLVLLLVGALSLAIGPLDRVKELFAGNKTAPEFDEAAVIAATGGAATEEATSGVAIENRNVESSDQPGATPRANEGEGTADDAVSGESVIPSSESEATSAVGNESGGVDVPDSNLVPDLNRVNELDVNVDPTGSANEPAKQEFVWEQVAGWNDSMLLTKNATGRLRRTVPGEALEPGSDLFVAPHSLIQLKTADQNEIKVLGPAVGGYAGTGEPLQLRFGRMLVTAGPSQIAELDTPQGRFRIQFSGPSSTAAVQFEHRFEKYGSVLDPKVFQPALVVVCDAPTEIIAVDQERIEFDLAAGEGLAVIAAEKPKTFKLQSIPAWYQLPLSRPIDQEAAAELSVDLVPDQTGEIAAKLNRLANHWRPEEAALAVSVSMLVGDWDAFVRGGFLENSRASIHIQPTLALARQLLAIRPNEADKLRKSLKNQFGNGPTLYRLILGSEQAELEGDGFTRLIDSLDADNLAERHLGFAELNRLTGRKLGFKPSQPNRASLLAWRREAAMSKLELVKLPDLVRERMNPR